MLKDSSMLVATNIARAMMGPGILSFLRRDRTAFLALRLFEMR
jgi:hypothetical protein